MTIASRLVLTIVGRMMDVIVMRIVIGVVVVILVRAIVLKNVVLPMFVSLYQEVINVYHIAATDQAGAGMELVTLEYIATEIMICAAMERHVIVIKNVFAEIVSGGSVAQRLTIVPRRAAVIMPQVAIVGAIRVV